MSQLVGTLTVSPGINFSVNGPNGFYYEGSSGTGITIDLTGGAGDYWCNIVTNWYVTPADGYNASPSSGNTRTMVTISESTSTPTVTTQAVSDISITTATGNGNVTATGGANITERGIYFSTTDGFADGAGTKVSTTGNWSTTGTFTQAISGLTANTTYYVKAFATNSVGTSYGSQVSFTTFGTPTISSFTPISGTVGTAVTITGTNFNTTPANNIVFFGATKATVSASSSTSLTVTVPSGASYAPITVLNTGTELAAYSLTNFNPTFTPNTDHITTSDIAAKSDVTTKANPRATAIGDIDGDGKPDLVVANYNSASISVFRNTGSSGSLSFAAKVDLTTGGDYPISIAIGDIDVDGKPDLAVANFNTSLVSIFRNTSTSGTISFEGKFDVTTGINARSVAIGDIDGDGKPDLAVGCVSTHAVSVLRNTGSSGTLSFATKVDITAAASVNSVAIGDMDGDGKHDLIASYTSGVSVFRNLSSSGSVSYDARQDFGTGQNPWSVVAGDLDGDHKLDLVVANFNSSSAYFVSVLRNTSTSGAISFATKVDLTTETNPASVAIGDINGDGKPDLAAANYGSASLSLFRNTGSSGSVSFATKVNFTTGTTPISIAIGDMDGDGKLDLATANYGSASVSVLRNDPVLPPTVTTTAISSITTTTALSGGNVTNDGGSTVTARGVCWNTSTSPTTANSKTTEAGTTGSYTSSLTGLSQNTTYYVRAYATNSEGTSYGSQVSFTTDAANIWDGSSGTAWGTAANWSENAVPTSATNAVIPLGKTVIISPTTFASCADLSNSGTLIIQSNLSSSGSLIVSGTSTGNVTYQRFVTGSSSTWHLFGAPVLNQGINDLITTGANSIGNNGAGKYGLGIHDESTNTWTTYTTATAPGAGVLLPGKGYEVLRTTDGIIDLTGTLSTAQVDVSVTRNGTGWNCIGNPFPSSIHGNSSADGSNNFISINTAELDDAYEALYLWNAATSSYDIVSNASGATYIAPAQAFFIKATAAGTINFTTAMRTHQASATFKNTASNSSWPEIKLKVESGETYRTTLIKYGEGMSFGLDPGYDAGIFDGIESDLVLNSRLLETHPVKFGIQCLPDHDYENMIIPIEVQSSVGNEVVFTADVLNFPDGLKVYLEDALNGSFTRLDQEDASYTANLLLGNPEGRFKIHTLYATSVGIDELGNQTSKHKITADYRKSCIRISGDLKPDAEVALYDIAGNLIDQQRLNGSNEFRVSNLKTGIYIVRLINDISVISEKIYWK